MVEWAYRVADVRVAERALIDRLPAGELMQRAATGLAAYCLRFLRKERGGVYGRSVVLLVGSGDNGGDALWAGSQLAKRGARVTALTMGERWHLSSAQALVAAGGAVEMADAYRHLELIESADLIVDGILGIGGSGGLRPPADALARAANASGATVVSVDLPSGIDADTGAVADPRAVVQADRTLTFGCLKPGLLITPGATWVGELTLVGIGLEPELTGTPELSLVDLVTAGKSLPVPGQLDDKYTRGVVGVVAGSPPYPGAAVLCTGSALAGGVGMVRYAGSASDGVAAHWPEVVLALDGPAKAGRVQAWVAGPGAGTDSDAIARINEVLASDVPVVLDADALTVLASTESVRARVLERADEGLVTIVTPHTGEFARLGFDLAHGANAQRVRSVREAAVQLGAVVLLKGARTVVAEPEGNVYVNAQTSSALATAGSGDVLAGLLGSMLASVAAKNPELSTDDAARVAASAALVHGHAGQCAAKSGAPATAVGILEALPAAIAEIRNAGKSST